MTPLISMHEMSFHGIYAAIELMLARRMKVELLERIRSFKDFERSACLKIHLDSVRGSHDVTWNCGVANQEAIVAVGMGNSSDVDGRLVSAFFPRCSGRSQRPPMRGPLIPV